MWLPAFGAGVGPSAGIGGGAPGGAAPYVIGGARPGAGVATLLCSARERTFARSVRGLANPWRLPALHLLALAGKEKGKGRAGALKIEAGTPRSVG
jgi:hypothetical protein